MPVLDNDMRVLEMSTFTTVVGGMPTDHELEWMSRRFLTLLTRPANSNQAGGMGYVMRATNCAGESFACKFLHPVEDADERQMRRRLSARRRSFVEEYNAHLAVSGVPGIPRVYGLGYANNGPVMVIEWVAGHTLNSASSLFPVASRGRGHAAAVVAALGVAVARVLLLARVRAQGFIHRDISPRNIMVKGTADDIRRQVASLDFKVSLIDMGSSYATPEGSTSFTMGEDIWRFGTPEYAAPEMLTRDVKGVELLRNSGSIDVYALCSVLYELYAGYTPYDLEHNEQLIGTSSYRIKSDFSPIALVLHEPQDRMLAQLILAGIAPDQKERITLEALYDGLQQILGHGGQTAQQVVKSAPHVGALQQVVLRPLAPGQGGGRACVPLPDSITRNMVAPQRSPQRTGVLRNLFG